MMLEFFGRCLKYKLENDMKSMTGYGRAMWESGNRRIEIELRSVNGRLFKLSSKLPQDLLPYEMDMKKILSEKISRGSVYITAHYNEEGLLQHQVNKALLMNYFKEFSSIAKELNISAPSMDTLLNSPGIWEEQPKTNISNDLWKNFQQVLEEALENLQQMRIREGEHLQKVILQYCNEIGDILKKVEALAPEIVANFQERLKNRLMELSNQENFHYSKEDILREVAIFSDRADISEEIYRLKSHLSQFYKILEKDEAVGKPLEFLTQEMIREINTIASKSNNAECSQLVVQTKATIEKIREQIQNVE